MFDAVQDWIPDPSHPLAPLVFGVVTTLAVLLVGGALSLLARNPAGPVTGGALTLSPLLDGELPSSSGRPDPVHDRGQRRYPLDAGATAPFTGGATTPERSSEDVPPGCVGTEVRVPIPYGRDFTLAMSVILEGCRGCEGVLQEPGSTVRVAGLMDSNIELAVRVWSRDSRSGSVAGDLRRAIADELGGAGFDIRPEDISTI